MTSSASSGKPSDVLSRLYAGHSRHWRDFTWVYPVVSRRSRGLSLGLNLNVDRLCNFDCTYCLVDRSEPSVFKPVDVEQLAFELNRLLDLYTSGELWRDEAFADTPAELRRINDIAFSGDGEPTLHPDFPEVVDRVIAIRAERHLTDARLVIITNATRLHHPAVEAAMRKLDHAGGEVWAKLDAGTPTYYHRIDRSSVPFERVLDNLTQCARRRPIIVQSMMLAMHGIPIEPAEFEAYLDRLEAILAAGGQIRLVQLYTIARHTAENYVTPLTAEQLTALAERLTQRLPDLPVQTYPGAA